MPYRVKQDFPGSPNGYEVINFKAGEPFEYDGELLATAIREDWVEEVTPTQAALIDSGAPAETVVKKAKNLGKRIRKAVTGK